MSWGCRARRVLAVLGLSTCTVALPFGGIVAAGAQTTTPDARQRIAGDLSAATGGKARIVYRGATGLARFVGTPAGTPLPHAVGVKPNATREQAARGFIAQNGALFGIKDQASELRTLPGRSRSRAVHFQQLYNGVPVLGGELAVDVVANGDVASVNGETLTNVPPSTTPRISAADASTAALTVTAKSHHVAVATLHASAPELSIYDNRILGGPGLDRPLLVWRSDVRNGDAGDIDELVLVSAATGGIALHFNQVEEAKTRQVCDRNNVVGGAEACTSPYTRSEGQAATGINEVDKAYDYAGSTYDFYLTKFGRDSVDGAGLPLKNTVRFCPSAQQCPYANAFWNGTQMVYGDTFAGADDVVAHELTHGVTQNESHLFYYYQSGALNESLSDVFGELVDLTNGLGNDTAGVRWQIGEDLPIGAIRNMANPPQFGDPDRTGSPNYTGGAGDRGGVHRNSGVNNKAAALLTDGGTFNGRTVLGLGTDKVARIYYKMAVDLLTSASDYQDVSELLPQACAALVGTNAITTTNCGQVTKVVLATEMNVTPTNAPAPEAPVCGTNEAPVNLFSDNLENTASGNWSLNPAAGTYRWYYPQNPNPFLDLTYATSGTKNMFGFDGDVTSDVTISRTANVAVPTGVSTYLRFNHAFDLESTFDGGRVEYSTNNGSTWIDAGSLFVNNGYTGSVGAFGGSAFTGTSRGYYSSRVNLTSLASQNVRFRFRIMTDGTVGVWGWWVDDVRVYRCNASAAPIANAGADKQVDSGAGFTLDGSGSSSPSGSTPLTYLWVQLSGTQAVINNDRAATTTVNGVPGGATLTFQLTVKDANGQTKTDTIVVTVKAPK